MATVAADSTRDALFDDEALRLLRVLEPGACDTLVVGFIASLGVPLSSHRSSWAAFELVGACRKAGATHALFVKDVNQAWYLQGTGPALPTFDALLRRPQREVLALRPRKRVTLGTSMGGYAAIRLGDRGLDG